MGTIKIQNPYDTLVLHVLDLFKVKFNSACPHVNLGMTFEGTSCQHQCAQRQKDKATKENVPTQVNETLTN